MFSQSSSGGWGAAVPTSSDPFDGRSMAVAAAAVAAPDVRTGAFRQSYLTGVLFQAATTVPFVGEATTKNAT